MARIALVAAVADNGVIGVGTVLPWRLSSDMKRFRALTIGKPVIMGRKTYETIGKPLAGRRNIVVTHRKDFAPDGVAVAATLEAALTLAAEGAADEIMVIGGGEVYAEAIGRADRLYITHVEAEPAGDTRFPPIYPAIWRAGPEERLPAGENDTAATRFIVYDRVR
jgi:dihydrofolate reductase